MVKMELKDISEGLLINSSGLCVKTIVENSEEMDSGLLNGTMWIRTCV